jgi:hypothetical protein
MKQYFSTANGIIVNVNAQDRKIVDYRGKKYLVRFEDFSQEGQMVSSVERRIAARQSHVPDKKAREIMDQLNIGSFLHGKTLPKVSISGQMFDRTTGVAIKSTETTPIVAYGRERYMVGYEVVQVEGRKAVEVIGQIREGKAFGVCSPIQERQAQKIMEDINTRELLKTMHREATIKDRGGEFFVRHV